MPLNLRIHLIIMSLPHLTRYVASVQVLNFVFPLQVAVELDILYSLLLKIYLRTCWKRKDSLSYGSSFPKLPQ